MVTHHDAGLDRRDWLLLVGALAGPIVISIVYLIAADLVNEMVPVRGYARAAQDQLTYWIYVACLALFVVAGTRRSRTPLLKTTFAAVSIPVSLFAMFVAFFARMAP